MEPFPIKNKTVVFTGDAEKFARFETCLQSEKASVSCIPFIKLIPSQISPENLNLIQNREYAGVLFTSANAVKYAFEVLPDSFTRKMAERNRSVFCVGSSTQAYLKTKGIHNIFCPDKEQSLQGVLALQSLRTCSGKYIWYPAGNLTDNHAVEALSKMDIRVDKTEVYKNIFPTETEDLALRFFSQNTVDWIIINSPSAGIRLKNWQERHQISFADVTFALIGLTTQTFFENHFPGCQFVTSDFPTPEGIVEAMKRFETAQKPSD